MPKLSSSAVAGARRHRITGLFIHMIGFVMGFVSIGLVIGGVIDIDSGLSVLTPFADILYGLGLVIVFTGAGRIGLPMKYLLIAGAVIGLGLFYKSAPHEIHDASGIGFGLPHNGHIVVGTIAITISVVAVSILAFVISRYRIDWPSDMKH